MFVSDSNVPSTANTHSQFLNDQIANYQPGHGLPGNFYSDETIYGAELDRIWRRGWLFAGHTCEVPEPGDYFTLELDKDSLIIVRDDKGQINALWNVCRHRGSELCQHGSGRVGRIVCPYHQWTYARDGALVSCWGMHEELNKQELGLRSVHIETVAGLIFVSFADEPPEFDSAREVLEAMVKPQGLDRAKVAKIVDYEVAANWKLVWENNRECYHCNVNHPQYIKANFDHYNADDTTDRVRQQINNAVAHSEQKWAAEGLEVSHRESGMTVFPSVESNGWYSANRTPLVPGFFSETMDGRQVAPLMGDYADADVGTLRMRTVPNLWNHSSCDHGVSTRLLPAGPKKTLVRVTWLVDAAAEEGRDYQLSDIMPFWQLTSEQDWELCERNQRGVDSSGYVPGPLSKFKEYNVQGLLNWYLQCMSAE